MRRWLMIVWKEGEKGGEGEEGEEGEGGDGEEELEEGGRRERQWTLWTHVKCQMQIKVSSSCWKKEEMIGMG